MVYGPSDGNFQGLNYRFVGTPYTCDQYRLGISMSFDQKSVVLFQPKYPLHRTVGSLLANWIYLCIVWKGYKQHLFRKGCLPEHCIKSLE